MTAEKAQQVLTRTAILPIAVNRHAVPRQELLALALRFGLSSYDAAYLELALRRQFPLATQDEALRAAALAAGVGCVGGVVYGALPSAPNLWLARKRNQP